MVLHLKFKARSISSVPFLQHLTPEMSLQELNEAGTTH